MKTSEVLAMLYLTSLAVIMSGENIFSAGCKDFCLGVFDHLRINWVVYVVNLFTVLYIVALAVNERKLEDENHQNTSPAPNESQKNILDVGFELIETEKETSNDSSDDDSGISTNSKTSNNVEEKENLNPGAKDLESEESRQDRLISQIKDILLGEPQNTGSVEEQDAKENHDFLDHTPLSPTEDVYETPQQFEEQRRAAINDGEWSDSSCDVSMDDISSYKLQTIEEESSLNSYSSPFNDAAGRSSVSPSREPKKSNWQKPSQQEHGLRVYTFSEPDNLLMPVRTRDTNAEQQSGHHKRQQDNVPASDTSLNTEDDILKTQSVGINFSDTQESERQVREETPNSNVSIDGSFADVSSMLSPGILSFSQRSDAESLKRVWSPGSPAYESLLNTSFSISSLEDFLSPEIRVPTASPHVNSDESLDPRDSRILGIRLHKPRGVNHVFLSIVSINKEKGLDTISETWTLGDREDMELILSVDTNPDSPSSKQYCGRYSLVFTDNGELDSFLDAAATSKDSVGFSFSSFQDEKEDADEEKKSLEKDNVPEEDCSSLENFLEAGTLRERFDFSFLNDQDEKEYATEEETSFEESSAPEEDFNKLSTSCFGRLVWKVASSGQTEYNVMSCDTTVDHALEEMNLELFKEEDETIEDEAGDDSLSTEIAVKLCNVSHELFHGEHSFMHSAMAAGCLFLTCFVLYRCTK